MFKLLNTIQINNDKKRISLLYIYSYDIHHNVKNYYKNPNRY